MKTFLNFSNVNNKIRLLYFSVVIKHIPGRKHVCSKNNIQKF